MDGVTILNIIPAFNSLTITIIFAILFVISMIVTVVILNEFNSFKPLCVSLVVLGLIGLGLLVSFFIPSQPERYEVSISDDVTFNDFIERYKIIEERGQIFIVEKRENYKETNQNEEI